MRPILLSDKPHRLPEKGLLPWDGGPSNVRCLPILGQQSYGSHWAPGNMAFGRFSSSPDTLFTTCLGQASSEHRAGMRSRVQEASGAFFSISNLVLLLFLFTLVPQLPPDLAGAQLSVGKQHQKRAFQASDLTGGHKSHHITIKPDINRVR